MFDMMLICCFLNSADSKQHPAEISSNLSLHPIDVTTQKLHALQCLSSRDDVRNLQISRLNPFGGLIAWHGLQPDRYA